MIVDQLMRLLFVGLATAALIIMINHTFKE